MPLLAQKAGNDTIPYGTSPVKSSDDFTWKTRVDTAITLVINELLARNSDLLYDNHGDDNDWFEIYNYGDDPVLLNKIWFTDDPSVPLQWKIDTTAPVYLYPGEYFLVWADDEPAEGYNHTNFKISGDGEFLGIFTTELQVIDQVVFQEQTPNVSYGRSQDAGMNWVFFDTPTPGRENSGSGGGMVLPAPASSKQGGIFDAPFSVQLSSPVAGAMIRYTLDANDPTEQSPLYENPIEINTTTILKASLFREGDLASIPLTCSYFITSKNYENPLVSIVAPPDDLFGERGLIKLNSSSLEIAAHFEYIDDRQTKYASGTGIQLHSVGSGKPASMRFYARSRYGNDWFGYPFFADHAPYYFKRLILRNSGNDNVNKHPLNTHFRDLLIHEIARKSFTDPMTAAGKPVNVFLNGSYYGIFNLRERIDQFYIETHKGVTDNYDLLERAFGFPANENPVFGSFDNWDALMSFADTTGNLAEQEDFEYLASQVDLENFTNYWMSEVFAGNYDWLSNNVKYWKPAEGKWQWIFWDLDHGLGLKYNEYGLVDWNTLKWSLTTSDRAWANGYNNRLIRNLMRNDPYRDQFIRHFATLLNTSFSFTSTEPVFDSLRIMYAADMVHHAERYENNMEDWALACDTVRSYLQRRPAALFAHLEDFFGLQEAVDVRLNVIPEGAGSIYWAGEKMPSPTLEGKYFPGLQYGISAEAIPGFSLSQWTINGDSAMPDTVTFTDPVEINAYFLPNGEQLPVRLTELYSNNRHYFDCGDWVEFFYYGFRPLDLSGAELLNGDDQVMFRFAEGTVIPSSTWFVIAEDKQSFGEVFPDSVVVFGNLTGSFSQHPEVKLRLSVGSVASQATFLNAPGWPELPAEGYSLELGQPANDPQYGVSWQLSHNRFGSPGLPNSRFYNFQRPSGKDSMLTNREPAWIRLATSDDYFSDSDGHVLAGIRVVSKEGPGKILCEGTPVTSSGILSPADLYYEPAAPYSKTTKLVYRMIDHSGESSDECTLEFIPETGTWEKIQSGWKVYPNPARDQIFIETGIAFLQPHEFILLDITGKKLLHKQLVNGSQKMSVHLSGLEPGIYIYVLQAHGQRLHGKIEVVR
ncbi:MAG: CotH kinase family protein [Bacteroidales bacterium]|nr:CotH kinase family protein [Bacteroidales bacterium]MDT8431594.1 CotH kinase family protein [Bacteroidales bacterium]